MKLEILDRDDHQKQIIAEFDSETLEKFKRKAARKISERTKIPGFRPGKAPYEMVRRIIGDAAILEEAIELLIDETYPKIIEEAKVEPYGPGKLDEIISMDPPKFSFLIPLQPEVDLGNYRELREEYAPPEVSEEDVEKILNRLRRRAGTAVPVERPAQQGDLVAIKMSAHLVSPEEGQEKVLIEENHFEMVAGVSEEHTDEDGYEWPFPGFVQELIGVSAGEKKVIKHTFSASDFSDDLAGKEAEFIIEVESVKEIVLPELDDSFAHLMGPYETLEALKNDIRQQLLSGKMEEYQRNYIDKVVDRLVDGASVKYPPVMVEDEVEHLLSHFREDLAKQQMDLEAYLKARQITREQLIDQEIRPAAEANVKRNLVLEEFARQEQIQIKASEIQTIYDIALNQARNDKELRQLAGKRMNTKQLADTMARMSINEIFNQRLINRLHAIATGKANEQPQPEEPPQSEETSPEAIEASQSSDEVSAGATEPQA
ncbi:MULTISPECIES: trigger factor [Anaerolinea]|uniref:trigger factor n=1 Tax=Anaerolinea TaxID=233189 RepID=UPI00260250E1|nr:trigger factor [Anaerolinea thermophila]